MGSRPSERKNISSDTREFAAWYRSFAECGFKYAAVMSRRCLNLMELVLQKFPDMEEVCAPIMTESGLLLKAEEIADYYVSHNEFPKIGLADELLLHGRALGSFLEKLFSLITDFLVRKNVHFSRNHLWTQFYDQITLWLFSVNDAPMLLREEYQWRIRCQHVWPQSKWRSFSLNISQKIWAGGVANTSYVLSARTTEKLPSVSCAENQWVRCGSRAQCYRNTKQVFYVFRSSRSRAVPSVRIYSANDRTLLIPYFFISDFTVDTGQQLLDMLADQICDPSRETAACLSKLRRLADDSLAYQELRGVFCQIVYLLLSQVVLAQFLADAGIDRRMLSFDTKKIARSFGNFTSFGVSIKSLLDTLCSIRWSPGLLNALCQVFRPEEHESQQSRQDSSVSVVLQKKLLDNVEHTVYLQAVKHEQAATCSERDYILDNNIAKNRIYSTQRTELNAFVITVLHRAAVPIQNIQNIHVIGTILSCLTQMMDHGDVSLKAGTWDDRICFSAVHTTESSLSIMPRRLGKYYGDFLRIAQFYWNRDEFPSRVRQYFDESGISLRTSGESITEEAVEFSKLIQKHKEIIGAILNWKPFT